MCVQEHNPSANHPHKKKRPQGHRQPSNGGPLGGDVFWSKKPGAKCCSELSVTDFCPWNSEPFLVPASGASFCACRACFCFFFGVHRLCFSRDQYSFVSWPCGARNYIAFPLCNDMLSCSCACSVPTQVLQSLSPRRCFPPVRKQ